MRRELGQLSLADGVVDGGSGCTRQLEKIAALVEWTAFEQLLGEVRMPVPRRRRKKRPNDDSKPSVAES
jgi:hypothetical protein